jgi:hypothetical protein
MEEKNLQQKNTLINVLKSQVKDVPEIILEYTKKYWYVYFPLLILGIIILKIGWREENISLINKGVIILCVEIVVIIMGYIYSQQQARKYFLKRFANIIGYSFSSFSLIDSNESALFSIGINETKGLSVTIPARKRTILNIATGQYEGFSVRLFTYQVPISDPDVLVTQQAQGPSYRTFSFLVFEVTLKKENINFILISKKSYFPIRNYKGVEEKINESSKSHYNLYTKDTILPQFLSKIKLIAEELQKINPKLSIEVYENKLYIFQNGAATRKRDIESIFESCEKILEEIK